MLVGLNRSRRFNSQFRKQRGAYPIVGDKLVCLRNNHANGLLNGSLWIVKQPLDVGGDGAIFLQIKSEDSGEPLAVKMHAAFFEGRAHKLLPWQRHRFDEFDYGYALNVHKAQGSQWRSVLLLDESRYFRTDRARWLYTGITRAAERVTIVVGRS